MKKGYLLLLSMLFVLKLSIAQVGINIKDSDKILHVDPKGNTSSSSNMDDDVVFDKSPSGTAVDPKTGISVGVGGVANPNASVDLQSANMGFLPNKVSLTGIYDVTTVPSPVEGMVVYNTEMAGVSPNDVKVGYYVYDGTSWLFMNTIASNQQQLILTTPITTKPSGGAADLDPANLTALTFDREIQIDEDGAYGFFLNFKGTTSKVTFSDDRLIGRSIFYVYMFKVYVDQTGAVKEDNIDMVELNPPFYTSKSLDDGSPITFTAPMGGVLKMGDKIVFKVSHLRSVLIPAITLHPGRDGTFLSYWKLQ